MRSTLIFFLLIVFLLDVIASPSTYPCQSVGQSVIDSIASPRFASFLICFLDLFSLPDPIFLASFFFSDCAEVTDPDPEQACLPKGSKKKKHFYYLQAVTGRAF